MDYSFKGATALSVQIDSCGMPGSVPGVLSLKVASVCVRAYARLHPFMCLCVPGCCLLTIASVHVSLCSRLLSADGDGQIKCWAMTDHLVNSWETSLGSGVDGDPIVALSWLHNGVKLALHVEMVMDQLILIFTVSTSSSQLSVWTL